MVLGVRTSWIGESVLLGGGGGVTSVRLWPLSAMEAPSVDSCCTCRNRLMFMEETIPESLEISPCRAIMAAVESA